MTTTHLKPGQVIGFALVLLACHASPGRAAETNVLFTITNTWRYWQAGSLDGSNWKAPDYDDAAWSSGAALFYATPAALPAPGDKTNTPDTQP